MSTLADRPEYDCAGRRQKGKRREPKMECWSEEKKSPMVQDGMVSEMEGKPEKQCHSNQG